VDYSVVQFSDGPKAAFVVVASLVHGFDEPTIEDLDRSNEVETMLKDIRSAFGFVPFAVHRR